VRVFYPIFLLQFEVQIVLFAVMLGLFNKAVLWNAEKVTLRLDLNAPE
jgi:hypothetical protein